jgi:hypothetical protein
MQTKRTSEQTSSPVPGVIPDPIRVRHDTVGVHQPTGSTVAPAPSRGRRNPFARLGRALRGDKYMVGAYPPGKER